MRFCGLPRRFLVLFPVLLSPAISDEAVRNGVAGQDEKPSDYGRDKKHDDARDEERQADEEKRQRLPRFLSLLATYFPIVLYIHRLTLYHKPSRRLLQRALPRCIVTSFGTGAFHENQSVSRN